MKCIISILTYTININVPVKAHLYSFQHLKSQFEFMTFDSQVKRMPILFTRPIYISLGKCQKSLNKLFSFISYCQKERSGLILIELIDIELSPVEICIKIIKEIKMAVQSHLMENWSLLSWE